MRLVDTTNRGDDLLLAYEDQDRSVFMLSDPGSHGRAILHALEQQKILARHPLPPPTSTAVVAQEAEDQ